MLPTAFQALLITTRQRSVATPAAMAPTFRVTSVQCPITRTGTTSPLEVTVTPSQDQPAIEPGIIQAALTIMELATPSIQVHVEDSIITITTGIKPTFPNATCGDYEESGSSNHKEQE